MNLPGEWSKQEFIQLVFPHKDTDWNGYLDEAIITEVSFFSLKSPVGAVWVFDDIGMYDHDMIEKEYLFPNGFEIIEKKNIKASYRKSK